MVLRRIDVVNTNGNGHNSRWWQLKGRSRLNGDALAPYRRIALQLHNDLKLPESRSVLLASPTASPLCPRGAITLATCLAEELHQRILLLDACPRTRETSRIMSCEDTPGFSDFIGNPNLPLESLALPTSRNNVWFLPAGSHTSSGLPAAPQAVESLLSAAQSQYDFVVLSAGSVLNDSMALALAPYVGCVLLLVIENESTVEELDGAQDALTYCRARKVGLVLTTAVRGSGAKEKESYLGLH